MRHYITKTEAIDQLIVPALGEHAPAHDLDGLAEDMLDFDMDRRMFFQSVTADEFWEVASQHEFQLDVDWVASDEEYNAVWKIVTSRSFEQGAVIASGYFKATEDEDESLANLDEALAVEGYKRGDQVTNEGDFDSFEVTTN